LKDRSPTKKGFGMSHAASSAVVSQGKQRAARDAAPIKRFENSKRGPTADSLAADPVNKRLPVAPHGRSSRRIVAPAVPAAKSRFSRPRTRGGISLVRQASTKKISSATAPSTNRGNARLPDPSQVAVGRAGDHPDVYQLLLAVFQGPSREEFYATQDDPTYEPANRLLLRHGGRLVSHLQLIPRTMGFGPLRLPVDRLAWLATLPEFRSQGFAGKLLEATSRVASGDAALFGLLRTRIPHFFHRWGWAVCGRHSRSRAKARNILARYWADPLLRAPPLNIRLWRHVELSALMRIYAQNTSGRFGPLERTEPYWRWLISRKAFDHIIVAIAGPDKLELDEASAPIVGYAVVRQQRVVELLTDPSYPNAGPQLLARACADAIERDQQEIELDAPPNDPLHQFVSAAGGQFHHREMDEQEVYMIKRPEMGGLVRCLAPLWESRLRDSATSRPCELGLHIGEQKHLLTVSRRGARSIPGRLGRNYIACSPAELTRLAMGHSNPAEAAEHGRLTASNQVALDFASLLFPRVQTWHPSWDDLAC
jgi:GNAT superfamily N-acetyltransferase